MMRVAYICADPGVPVFGSKGCSIHVQEVIRAFQRLGAHIDLFASSFAGKRPPGLEQVQLHPLPAVPMREPAQREAVLLGSNDTLTDSLERAGKFDLVYERYSLWSFAGMEHAFRKGVPGLLEINAPLIEEQARYRKLVNRETAEAVARRCFRAAGWLLAVSEGVARYLRNFDEAQGAVKVVPNGVNPARFTAAVARARPASGLFTVGFVGSLKPWHGVDCLVQGFARLRKTHPDCRLLIVGDGPERGNLNNLLVALGLDQAVELVGAVQPGEIPGFLASMDVAVAPYPPLEDFYFSPLKVYEYMAAGLPVVASRVGQIADLIQPEKDGLLCPPGDPAALCGALARLHSSPELRQRLGGKARHKMCTRYTWNAVVERILELADLSVHPALLTERMD